MPHKFAFTLQSAEGEPTPYAGEFSDQDHILLLSYSNEYTVLSQSSVLQGGVPCQLKVSGERGKPIDVQVALPTSDQLSILLHRLRPFILEKEPASFVKTLSCLGKNVPDPNFREFLRTIRELYDGREFQSQMRIASDEQLLNCERIVFDWLNAFEYHRAPDKQQQIQALIDNTPGELLKFLVVSMLVDKFRAIERTAAIVSVLLGITKSVHFAGSDNC